MTYTLSTYATVSGGTIQIVTPTPLPGDAAQAVNANFVSIADSIITVATAAAAVASSITSHTSNLSNPHVTTAAQVGALPIAGGEITGNLAVDGSTSLDNGAIQTDGNGTITALSVIGNCWSIFGGGNVSFDNGAILTDGNGNITLQNCVINFPDGQSFEVVQGYPDFLFYGGPVYVDEGLTIAGTTSLDNGYITTSGNGYITAQDIYLNSAVGSVADAISSLQSEINNNEDVDFAEVEISNFLSVNGTTSLDNGAIHTDGNGTLQAAAYNYNNGAPLTDSNGNLYYNNGNFVADRNGLLYYGNGNTLTDNYGNLTANDIYIADLNSMNGGSLVGIISELNAQIDDAGITPTLNTILQSGGNDAELADISNVGNLSVIYTTSLDNGQIYTDGNGNLTVNGTTELNGGQIYTDLSGALFLQSNLTVSGEFETDNGNISSDGDGNLTVNGTTSLDDGSIHTDGYGTLTLQSLIAAPQSSAPSSPTMGQIYCDTSGNVHVYNGTAWKQFTVS